jgi:hypothetical protein
MRDYRGIVTSSLPLPDENAPAQSPEELQVVDLTDQVLAVVRTPLS